MIRSSEMCEEFDPLEEMTAEANCNIYTWLCRQDWECWADLSGGSYETTIRVWFRDTDWMIEIAPGDEQNRYLKVPDLPTALDLLARWGQIAVVEKLHRILVDVSEGALDRSGLVETIAARGAWGIEYVTRTLTNDLRVREDRMEKRAREFREKQAAKEAALKLEVKHG